MTLPTVAGVQSRIRTLPDRPPFMIADDLAEFYGVQVKRVMEQVRRNQNRFPEGFIFELTEEEYRKQLPHFAATAGEKSAHFAETSSRKSPHFGATSQGKRHDLTHYGFTEKGALQLSSVLTGPVADAVSVTIINAFVSLRDEREILLRNAAFQDETAYVGRSRMRVAIKLAVEKGWTFGQLWGAHDWSAPKLARAVEDMRIRGYIPEAALFVPVYVLGRRRGDIERLNAHAEDDRQGRMKFDA